MSWRRVRAVALRQWWTLRHSGPRQFEMLFWPVMEIIVWGLVTLYLLQQVGAQILPGYFIGGMTLWVVLNRCQEELAIAVLEESWSENMLNLAGSPLKPIEYLAGSLLVSLLKACLTATTMALLARLLYGYNILELWPALPFAIAALVITGWSLGLITVGLILRYGRRVDVLGWSFSHFFQPLACAVYPVKVLPPALQAVAGLLPASHAFEATRAATQGDLAVGELVIGLALSVIWLVLAALFCQTGVQRAREVGRLSSLGE